jgi:hypothetical protein
MKTPDDLMALPGFLPVLQAYIKSSMSNYAELEGLLRFVDNQEKWLLSFLIYRQWIDATAPGGSGKVYLSQIWDEARTLKATSRNTVNNFFNAFAAYGFIDKVAHGADRRVLELHFPHIIHKSFFRWYLGYARSLDALDGGKRTITLEADPQLIRKVHPRMLEMLLKDDQWRVPPRHINVFYSVKNGNLILDYMFSCLDLQTVDKAGYSAHTMSGTDLARRFFVGRSTVHRLFQTAATHGLLAIVGNAKDSQVWVSRDFVMEYVAWQARKMARLDNAFSIL